MIEEVKNNVKFALVLLHNIQCWSARPAPVSSFPIHRSQTKLCSTWHCIMWKFKSAFGCSNTKAQTWPWRSLLAVCHQAMSPTPAGPYLRRSARDRQCQPHFAHLWP